MVRFLSLDDIKKWLMSFNKQRKYYVRNNFCSFRTLPPPSQSLVTTNTVAEKTGFNIKLLESHPQMN